MRHLAILAALGMMGAPSAPAPRRREEENPPLKFKTCFLMRGLPGTGKSSVAKSLVGGGGQHVISKVPDPEGGTPERYRFILCNHGVVCTTDAYFYEDWEGDSDYNFNPANIGRNHQLNQNAVSYAMSQGIPGIVVDNTNTQNWEMEQYVKLAAHYGYKIVVVQVPHVSVDLCEERNTHNVPRNVLENMERKIAQKPYLLGGTDGEKL